MRMMRLPFPFRPDLLCAALAEAGVTVVTIRSSWGRRPPQDDICLWGVVVFDDAFDLEGRRAEILAVVDAHLASPEVSGKKPFSSAADQESSLRKLEAG